jgi:hypothetical protein
MFSYRHIYIDRLQFELVVNRMQQRQCFITRHMVATQFDPNRSAFEFRVRFRHLAIQNKRRIGVKFLLQFVQLLLTSRPWARFVHYQKHVTGLLIDCEQVDHAGIAEATLRVCHAIVAGLNAIDFAR